MQKCDTKLRRDGQADKRDVICTLIFLGFIR